MPRSVIRWVRALQVDFSRMQGKYSPTFLTVADQRKLELLLFYWLFVVPDKDSTTALGGLFSMLS
jgi:hypothetical protein